jgi:hypothetical protein
MLSTLFIFIIYYYAVTYFDDLCIIIVYVYIIRTYRRNNFEIRDGFEVYFNRVLRDVVSGEFEVWCLFRLKAATDFRWKRESLNY